VLTLGSATDMQARIMLHRHHLEDQRDYSLIEAPFPTMKDLLFSGKASLVAIAPPFAFDPELRARSTMLFTESDAMGPTQLTALAAKAEFLTANRAALVDFMEDAIRTVRWYVDPANHAAAVALIAAYNKQPPETLGRLFTTADNYRDPNGEPDLAALQSNLDTQRQLGLLKNPIDIRKYADLGIVRAAAARLK
jgi:NitT/TauT family transport system substrate-binding protein